MQAREQLYIEAEKITLYLLGISPGEEDKQTYADAMGKVGIQLSAYEQALWNSMLRSRRKMAYIDAGLALKDPLNNVRRKLFTMLAILEASPDHTTFFLSRNFSFFYLFRIVLVGIRSIWRAAIGSFMVNSIQRKCS